MVSISKTYNFLVKVLFQKPDTIFQLRTKHLLVFMLFLLGIGHLLVFFNAGNLDLIAHDWIKEDAYLNTLRQAQVNKVIPWTWSIPFYHGTHKFLANPEFILTPDIFLLPWISNSYFILIHVFIFYSIGFIGCLKIYQKLDISFVSFLFFWMAFNFNGFLFAHFSVGHLQWAGYYLLPFFFLGLFNITLESRKKPLKLNNHALWTGILIGTLYINGSFHIAIWCMIFMLILTLLNWSIFTNIFAVFIIGNMIGVFRLLPAALWFPKKYSFISGYPDFSTLIDSFTAIREQEFSTNRGMFGGLGWWEYDIHIGFVALFFIAIGSYITLKHARHPIQTPFLLAASAMFILSLGTVYALISRLNIPVFGVERVSSRLIIIPFIIFLLIATKGIDLLLRSGTKEVRIIISAGMPFMLFELVAHSYYWRIIRLERSTEEWIKPNLTLLENTDHLYAMSVYASWTISFLFLFFLLHLIYRYRT